MEIKGIDAVVKRLEKGKALVNNSITETKRKVVYDVYEDLVRLSPQFSGNLAKQWYIEGGGHKGRYSKIPQYIGPKSKRTRTLTSEYHRGSDPAVSEAIMRELGKLGDIRWNSKVRIVNYAPYAADVEEGLGPIGKDGNPLPIRPENLYYGRVAMSAFVINKYNRIKVLRSR